MIIERAYAKINLFLGVKDRREDGFHNIKSVMHSVTLFDIVSVSASDSDTRRITVHTDCQELPLGEDNLVYRSAEKYLSKFNKNATVDIKLDKRIPIGAGLAGGSSDAAATLRALNKIFKLANSDQLLELAAEIGSDVPYCLLGDTALCEGRGEVMTRLPSPKAMHFVIAIGKERVSTPRAYRALDELYGDAFPCNNEDLERLISSLNEGIKCEYLYNIFEDVVKLPEIEKIKEMLIKNKAVATLMSGSGPSVFGIFSSLSEAQNAAAHITNSGFEAYYATSASNGENV